MPDSTWTVLADIHSLYRFHVIFHCYTAYTDSVTATLHMYFFKKCPPDYSNIIANGT